MKKRRLKICLLAAVTVAMFTLFAATTLSASAERTLDGGDLFVINGAYIRTEEPVGLKFESKITQADKAMIDNYAGENGKVIYGMTIVPDSYRTETGEITAENMYGNNAVYFWEQDGKDPDGKTQILNYTTENLLKDGDDYFLRYSIVNIKAQNHIKDFYCKAYFIIEKGGETEYYFQNDNKDYCVRNVTYVAQKAQQDPKHAEDENLQNIFANIIDVAVNNSEKIYSYKTEYYLETDIGSGVYEKNDALTEVVSGKGINEEVTATEKQIADYILVRNEGEIGTGRVIIDNSLTLKLYYKKTASRELYQKIAGFYSSATLIRDLIINEDASLTTFYGVVSGNIKLEATSSTAGTFTLNFTKAWQATSTGNYTINGNVVTLAVSGAYGLSGASDVTFVKGEEVSQAKYSDIKGIYHTSTADPKYSFFIFNDDKTFSVYKEGVEGTYVAYETGFIYLTYSTEITDVFLFDYENGTFTGYVNKLWATITAAKKAADYNAFAGTYVSGSFDIVFNVDGTLTAVGGAVEGEYVLYPTGENTGKLHIKWTKAWDREDPNGDDALYVIEDGVMKVVYDASEQFGLSGLKGLTFNKQA